MDSSASTPASQSCNQPPSSQTTEQAPTALDPLRRASSNASLSYPRAEGIRELLDINSTVPTSRTWTPSSGGLNLPSGTDETQNRVHFVEMYNRLASKNGVRPLVVGDLDAHLHGRNGSSSPEKKSWFARIFRGPSNQSTPKKANPVPRSTHKRSSSDLGSFLRSKSDAPRALEVQDLVRLTGRSVLYLPPAFSPYDLVLPTCIRATAHYLAQNPANRGLFRIPGSARTVNALCDYYCGESRSGPFISSTTYLPTLPDFIPHHIHDVASTFKRMLSGLPRGILGSLSLLDALLAIYSQLQDRPEMSVSGQARTRAQLIALAIGTIESKLQRDLICAVFGLLSLIGRLGELSPPSDGNGRPNQFMTYSTLGVVFGPLLVSLDDLNNYDIKSSSPTSGLLLIPIPPKKQRRDRQKAKESGDAVTAIPGFEKFGVLNSVAEMLIANWRDVVRQMRALGTHRDQEMAPLQEMHADGYSSLSESSVANHTADSDLLAVRDDEDIGELPGKDNGHGSGYTSVTIKRTKSTRSTRSTRSTKSRMSRQGSVKRPSRQSSVHLMTPAMEEGHQGEDNSNLNPFPTTYTGDMAGPVSTGNRKVTPPPKPLF
ncbi:hypothetical protein TrVFT333_000167 [Trichoderma virens FT-333]|nr:hypothetical protein TrVFT333_000167 [Trichoderma virens FT-333]